MTDKPHHKEECYTEVRRVEGHGYWELYWICVDGCEANG